MALPDVTPEAILEAMNKFDREQRNTPAWEKWMEYENFRYALVHNERPYPVKQIVALATGADVKDFNSNNARNYLELKGFIIKPLDELDPEWDTALSIEERLRRLSVDNSSLTTAQAGLKSKDLYEIILQAISVKGGVASINDIYDAIEARMNGKELSNQGRNSLRRTVSSDAVKAGYIFPYDSNNPGWRITPKGKDFINSLNGVSPENELLQKAKEAFDEVKSLPIFSLQVKVRRKRAEQLRALLSRPNEITVEQFNREVWGFESGTKLRGVEIPSIFSPKNSISQAQLEEIEEALDAGELEMHGNYIWGSGTRVYGSQYGDKDPDSSLRTENIRQALTTLNRKDLSPQEKDKLIRKVYGFGDNITTGLVMVYHPAEFAIYNTQSKEALTLLGYTVTTLGEFEKAAQDLKAVLGAEDYLEQDWFLYWLNHQQVANEPESLKELKLLLEKEVDFTREEPEAEVPTQQTLNLLEHWQKMIVAEAKNPLVKRLALEFIEWLQKNFGKRIAFYPSTGEKIEVWIDKKWAFTAYFNQKNALFLHIDLQTTENFDHLRANLSDPRNVSKGPKRLGGDKYPVYSFWVLTERDYVALKEYLAGSLAAQSSNWPPQPLDGPAFVMVHSVDWGEQVLGETYVFNSEASGEAARLIRAVEDFLTKTTPLYLIFYLTGPKYSFDGWATVRKAESQKVEGKDGWKLSLEYHSFPNKVNLHDKLIFKHLSENINWLSKGLSKAFWQYSIRNITEKDFWEIIETANELEGGTIGMTNAAYTILLEAGGKTMSASEILTQAKERGLVGSTVSALDLSSEMLKESDRFMQLNSDTWRLTQAFLPSRLPKAWTTLGAYLDFAHSLDNRPYTADELYAEATQFGQGFDSTLDEAELVDNLRQFRLIHSDGQGGYIHQEYVGGDKSAVLSLMALALLIPVEGSTEFYELPARQIFSSDWADVTPRPLSEFAPDLTNDSPKLLEWYVEAGLVESSGDTWQPTPDALSELAGEDVATILYNLFLETLLDPNRQNDLEEIDGNLRLITNEKLEAQLQKLGQELLIDTKIVKRVYRSLISGRNVVLSGPPGTGKTELAKRLPTLLWEEEPQTFTRLTTNLDLPPVVTRTEQRLGYKAMVVTATEDWGVRDVVGGIGPRLGEDGKTLSYEIKHGVLTKAILQNYGDSNELPSNPTNPKRQDYWEGEKRYRGVWLVIDEFTRAPVDAAFGSLLTTLGGGKDVHLAIPTPAGEVQLYLYPDFRIIGTLNSFDRHFLNQISEAIKRRFDFIDVMPPSSDDKVYEQGIAVNNALKRLARNGFNQIAVNENTCVWQNVVEVEIVGEVNGLTRMQYNALNPDAKEALESFWRIFEAIRVFRQLGTAQAEAVYTNLFAGSVVLENWKEALDTALADSLADQLQVLNRDEQRILEAFVIYAGKPTEFVARVKDIMGKLPKGRAESLRYLLSEAKKSRKILDGGDIEPQNSTHPTDLQLTALFPAEHSLAMPTPEESVFLKRLQGLMGERGL